MRLSSVLIVAVALSPLVAQELSLPPNLEALSERAEESVKVTLDGALLQLAAKAIPEDDRESAAVKKIIAGIQGIYVRSFEFENDGEYSAADVASAKAQFHDASWSKIVSLKSKVDGEVEVYVRSAAEGKLGGVGVIAAEAREFTIVRIVGEISPAQLVALGGEFHIPRLKLADHSGGEERE